MPKKKGKQLSFIALLRKKLGSMGILALALIAAVALPVFLLQANQSNLSTHAATSYPPTTGTQHYLYNFTDGMMYVYDIDNNFNLVYSIAQPTTSGVRGMVASPTDGMLYIAYGGAGGSTGTGGLLKYNLLTNTVVWQKPYTFGIDSPGITPDGKTVYLAEGEFSGTNLWAVIDTATGNVITTITAGTGPHNTIVSLNGKHVYMAARYTPSDYIADTATNTVIGSFGPLKNGGGRPFTINGTETYAFTTQESYLGFQISDLTTGQVKYTVPVTGFTNNGSMLIPDHGISLSPDEKEIYLVDGVNDYVHVFDVSNIANAPPTQVADIKLTTPISGQSESSCAYDCGKEGWMLHSTSGKYVFVGDAGDVIDTTTRTVAAHIPTLANSRKYIEIDWQNGQPSFTTNRYGLGYVTTPLPPTTPTPSFSPTPSPVPGAIVAQDTFQRANQSFWGTASDGNVWAGDANVNGVFSIANNTGQAANGNTNYNAILGGKITNAELLFSGSMSKFSSSNIGGVLRWTDTNNWYKAYIDGANFIVQKKVNGTTTTLKSVPFAASAGVNYSIRFQASGTNFFAKVWPTASTEPATWMISATDTTFSSGFAGLRPSINGTIKANYTSFTVTTLAGSATPTPTPSTTAVTSTPTTAPVLTFTPTPTPVVSAGIISQDTFQRANQTFWGTASDGNTWTSDAATNSIFTITGNTGQVKGGSTAYNAILGASAANEQVFFTGSMSTFSGTNLGAVIRWKDTNNWYKAYIDGTNLVMQKKVNGTTTTITSLAFKATAGTNYSLRFQIVGSTLSAKVWPTASVEPSGWTVTGTDTALTSGYCGLRMQVASGITATYTSFVAMSL